MVETLVIVLEYHYHEVYIRNPNFKGRTKILYVMICWQLILPTIFNGIYRLFIKPRLAGLKYFNVLRNTMKNIFYSTELKMNAKIKFYFLNYML